jgi:hypothetical protein
VAWAIHTLKNLILFSTNKIISLYLSLNVLGFFSPSSCESLVGFALCREEGKGVIYTVVV